jgi:hypothetical protein
MYRESKRGITDDERASNVLSDISFMSRLPFDRQIKNETLRHRDMRIISAGETDAEPVRSALPTFDHRPETLDHVSDLIIVTLTKSVHKACNWPAPLYTQYSFEQGD